MVQKDTSNDYERLIKKAKSLQKRVREAIQDSSDVTSKYSSYKICAEQYNELLQQASIYGVHGKSFHIERIPSFGDTLPSHRRQILEMVESGVDELLIDLDEQRDTVMDKFTQKKTKIFISHSSKDSKFVNDLVELLEFMGLDEKDIFCSSIPEYGIPNSGEIFGNLRKQFDDYDLHVLFIHSKNYYASPISLNEMGAAWVLKNKFTSFLVPGFEYSEMTGIVNNQWIAIKVDDKDARSRINFFYEEIRKEFQLEEKMTWERRRDEFIDKIIHENPLLEDIDNSGQIKTEEVEAVTAKYANNCARLFGALGFSMKDEELKESAQTINKTIGQIEQLPNETRRLLSVMVKRSYTVNNPLMDYCRVRLYEIEKLVGKTAGEIYPNIKIMARIGICSDVQYEEENENLPIVDIFPDKETGWNVWNDIREFCIKTGTRIEDICVNADLSSLDK